MGEGEQMLWRIRRDIKRSREKRQRVFEEGGEETETSIWRTVSNEHKRREWTENKEEK